jgi:hypothetical protein
VAVAQLEKFEGREGGGSTIGEELVKHIKHTD